MFQPKPTAETLEDQLLRGAALGVAHAALAGVLGDAGEGRGHADGLLGRGRERAVAHRRDHDRHRELQRLGAVEAADLGLHGDLGDHVAVELARVDRHPEGQVGGVRQRPGAAVAAHPIAADLRFDVEVLLDLAVPIVALAGEAEVGDRAHLPLAGRVAQALTGVDDLLEAACVGDLVALEELADRVQLLGRQVGQLGVGAERLHFAADVDVARCHVLADPLAGVAEDDDAAAVHHVAGHEVRVAEAAEGAGFHHLAGARAHVALDDDLGAADRHAGDRPGIAADDHRTVVDVVGQAPANVVLDLEARAVGESAAEVAGRAAHPHGHGLALGNGQADADVVLGVGVEDLDVLARLAAGADALVGLADRDRREIYLCHVS